jgi:hypothetical protein
MLALSPKPLPFVDVLSIFIHSFVITSYTKAGHAHARKSRFQIKDAIAGCVQRSAALLRNRTLN